MTGKEFRKIRESLGLSRDELGQRMELSRATLQRREASESIPPAEAAFVLLLAREADSRWWWKWRISQARKKPEAVFQEWQRDRIVELRERGETFKRIGELLGMTFQRASLIYREAVEDESQG